MKAALGPVARVQDVPSLGVTRIVIELPIEFHVAATTLLHGKVALLTVAGPELLRRASYGVIDGAEQPPGAEEAAAGIPEVERQPKGGKLCKDAAVICESGDFLSFLRLKGIDTLGERGAKNAAAFVRMHCGIDSRAELDHNPEAARKFAGLMRQFREWMRMRTPA